MRDSHDNTLSAIATRLEEQDPRFADGLSRGRPRRPREYDRRGTWAVLILALVLLGVGIVVGHGLLIATALVAAGAACHWFERPSGRSR
ncbi:DUF3040 domain-containing protein [Streptomyces sp. cg35]|uniref:DUF3040 domain-containing protein n=1 Tax=Streptomyces sp. cg35 TaxID=3421650 RepID=UPI003D16AD8A